MPSLQEHRQAFLAQVQSFVPHLEEQKRFGQVLDYFIEWSKKHPNEVAHLEATYNGTLVTFIRTRDRAVLWTASPARADGARFEVLPRPRRALTTEQLQDAREVFDSLAADAGENGTTLKVRFGALKSPNARERVGALLERMLAE